MLKRTPRTGKDVEVTFRMPPIHGVVELFLCGDFNNWQTAGAPLTQEADGSWVVTLVLEAGKSYRFRYLDNQGRWHNDWEADAYTPNAFGSEDSVVDLTAMRPQVQSEAAQVSPGRKQATKKTAAKKAPALKRAPGASAKTPRVSRSGSGKKRTRG